jgi:hypothetical protein
VLLNACAADRMITFNQLVDLHELCINVVDE